MQCLCKTHLQPLKDRIILMGDFLIKKIISVICAALFLFSINVFAQKEKIVESIKPYGEFYIYGEDNSEIAQIFGMSEADLNDHCNDNAVAYLAVNKDNSKQIKVTHTVTDFSSSIVNISGLTDSNITALIPDITGVEGAKGDIINKNGQKFVMTQFKTVDSGGEYILTQYFTVADKTNIVLSFYTKATVNREYIEKTFETFTSKLFITNDSPKKDYYSYSWILITAAAIFAVACAVIIFTIIRDIRKENIAVLDVEENEENDQ